MILLITKENKHCFRSYIPQVYYDMLDRSDVLALGCTDSSGTAAAAAVLQETAEHVALSWIGTGEDYRGTGCATALLERIRELLPHEETMTADILEPEMMGVSALLWKAGFRETGTNKLLYRTTVGKVLETPLFSREIEHKGVRPLQAVSGGELEAFTRRIQEKGRTPVFPHPIHKEEYLQEDSLVCLHNGAIVGILLMQELGGGVLMLSAVQVIGGPAVLAALFHALETRLKKSRSPQTELVFAAVNYRAEELAEKLLPDAERSVVRGWAYGRTLPPV